MDWVIRWSKNTLFWWKAWRLLPNNLQRLPTLTFAIWLCCSFKTVWYQTPSDRYF
jgi:hypothetical protein